MFTLFTKQTMDHTDTKDNAEFTEEAIIIFLAGNPYSPAADIAKHFFGESGTGKDVNATLHRMKRTAGTITPTKIDGETKFVWRVAVDSDKNIKAEKRQLRASDRKERQTGTDDRKERQTTKGPNRDRKNKNFSRTTDSADTEGEGSGKMSTKKTLDMREFVSKTEERTKLVRDINNKVKNMTLGDLRELHSALEAN